MKNVIFFAIVLFISSCSELRQKHPQKGDTTKVLNVVKSTHFASLKESSFGKVDLYENDSTIEVNYLPSNFDVNVDSLERQFGTYTISKKQVYFADLNDDDMIDALVGLSSVSYTHLDVYKRQLVSRFFCYRLIIFVAHAISLN